MKPALTAEEWADARTIGIVGARDYYGTHAAAALALDGEEFGPKREMVARLQGLIADVSRLPTSITDEDDADWLQEIADFIEALLPPHK